MATSPSQIQQNYQQECDTAINTQIQLQMYATHIYLSMASYFNQDEVALGYFALFFLNRSQKWRRRTDTLFLLLFQRHGCLAPRRTVEQNLHDWFDGLMAMECALHLEKTIHQSLLDLYQLATNKGDAYLCIFLKCHFLSQQVEDLKELGDFVTALRQLGAPGNHMAQYLFDKLTLAESTKKN